MIKDLGFSISEEEILTKCESDIFHELNVLSNLDENEMKEKNSDIKEMITYYSALTQKKEEGREKIYQYSLQILLICITGFGLFLTQLNSINIIRTSDAIASVIVFATLMIIIEQIILTLFIILLYYYQSSFPYPFRTFEQFGNKWKWFYYGNEAITKISTREILVERKIEKTLKPYLDGLKFFIHEYSEEKLKTEIQNNIIQLYLLQVHNYYKNRFHLQLTAIQKNSMIVLVVTVCLAIIWITVSLIFI
jgi:hypothetical protein